jgi:hypothetical protein
MKKFSQLTALLIALAALALPVAAAQYESITLISSNLLGALSTNTHNVFLSVDEVEDIAIEMICAPAVNSTSNVTVNLTYSMDGVNKDASYSFAFARAQLGAGGTNYFMTNLSVKGIGYIVAATTWNQDEVALTNFVLRAWRKYIKRK